MIKYEFILEQLLYEGMVLEDQFFYFDLFMEEEILWMYDVVYWEKFKI